ncbi:hypothetical protein L5515_000199 [Caenorhabditis briggsae]|uniref:Major facilitator superfamily (MFS) profile domain-containing protein n=1 Tax=Caenorhabditis briggsae TaxID=6238 RepID=A0AAE9J1I0_CAEBR|nr:hypothetical protein L5515_000199 [Caenorhabditis briggsae]
MVTSPIPVRFLILICATLCLTSILSNMNTYNFTKICMQDDNSTMKVSTALVPLASTIGYGWFVTARIFQGMAFSATFPLAGSITANWATPYEHGVFIGLLTGNTQLSNIFTMPISGWLCSSSGGWTSVYYVHAGVSLVTFLLFLLFFKSSPKEHSWVGEKELETIGRGKVAKKTSRPKDLPFRHILTSLSLWACWIASFGDLITVQLVSQFNPQYMKNYLDYDVLSSGFLAALPIIFQFLTKLSSGIISDWITFINETWKTKIFNTIALAVAAGFFIILAFIPQEKHLLAIIIMICAESVMGCNTAGFNKCATLHSQQYAYFSMQQIMNIWACTIFIEPFFVNMIVKENTFIDWRNCFLAHAILLLTVNTVFCIFADASPAKWTKSTILESGNLEISEEKKRYDSIVNTKLVPPSPPSYAMAPMLQMSAPPTLRDSYALALPPPPPPPPPSHHSPFISHNSVMMASQIPFLAALDPPIPSISSSAFPQPIDNSIIDSDAHKSQYEVPRWDRQKPEYKHLDETDAVVVAPDVIVADIVDEKSSDSEKVEKIHENERLARMDLKYEEPEPTPFENGTVIFHAWFVRKL